MPLQLIRKLIGNNYINYCTRSGFTFGFSEWDVTLPDLSGFFGIGKTVELNQIHSDIILNASSVTPVSQGDGLFLDEENTLLVIKTADCLPLFFWHDKLQVAGILHIGWRGLLSGIEQKLITLLREKSTSPLEFFFYMGPAIEAKCYEVGPDLYQKFRNKTYLEKVFFPQANSEEEKFHLDLKKAVRLSLQEKGIAEKRIMNSGECNFCQPSRFPSYRRDGKGGGRIYNFMIKN